MKLTYTKFETPKKINCYEIHFCYEHGDGDSETSTVETLTNINENQFIEYLQQVDIVAEMIYQNRAYGVDLPTSFSSSKLLNIHNHYIPVALDDYAKLSTSNYYADMTYEKIYYYNENGIKFTIKVEK